MPADRARARWAPIVPDPPARETPTPARPAPSALPHATAGAVARRALESSLAILLEREAELNTGDDPEHVHQARVATRRLRSDLRTFRALFDEAWAADLRTELRWLGGVLGRVRDADVLLGRLSARVEELPAMDRVGAETLLDRIRERRERSGAELATALDSNRYAELRGRLLAAAQAPVLTPLGAEPAVLVLPALVRRPWKRLRRRVRKLGADPSDAALHEVRIAAKRCRYAAAAVEPAVGDPAAQFAKALARVQNRLGEHQDAVVAEAWLRGAALDAASHTAFVAGELAAVEHRSALDARSRWRSAWEAARRAQLP